MNEEKKKVVEPSAIDNLIAEFRSWRAGRGKNTSAKRLKKAQRFNDNRHKRKRSIGPSLFFVGVMAIIEMGFGLLKFMFWIAAIGGIIWVITTVDVEEVMKDAAVEKGKEKAGEVRQKIKNESTDIIGSLREAINEIREDWHIEIRTKGEDGEEKVIEFGTKKDDVPEESSDE